jgi:hypothetical protein
MRSTVVDGTSFACPMYVVRCGDGWQLRLPGEATRFFADGTHGGAERSHEAAIRARAEALPVTSQSRPLAAAERSGKRWPTGLPGVHLQRKHRRGKARAEVQLQVRVPGMPTRTIYVGTEATYEARLDAKLEIAAQVREQLQAELLRSSTVKLIRRGGRNAVAARRSLPAD